MILLFILYFFTASRPIPLENVLSPRWLSSLWSDRPVVINSAERDSGGAPLPFTLGGRFGYVDPEGRFLINNEKTGEIYLDADKWAEYEAEPAAIEIKYISGETAASIEDAKGYPLLLDGRTLILGSEQNKLSEIGPDGNTLWTYDFGAPLTCVDAASGLILTGSIDGIVEILDANGRRIFFFEPGGSRYTVILGCAISRNGIYLGIISGVEDQRFLLLERYGDSGGEYKVIHHEFLESGFRRPVHITFIDDDHRVIFERAGGIGCYNIKSRQGIRIPLDGAVSAMDASGDQGFFFVICSYPGDRKELVSVKFPQDRVLPLSLIWRDPPNLIVQKTSFKSGDAFLGRKGPSIVVGGGQSLISFDLEKK
ncbi:MAG: WD40 repeat domain-containing protein [Treponema sp.]|nr:WD40 repeat domain-containing protein [Treponema sp.]